nr:MAG TPA: hypothetical protein [Caudoviricetes sp.]
MQALQRANNQVFTRMQQGTKRRTNNAKCTHRAKPMERATTYCEPRSFRR